MKRLVLYIMFAFIGINASADIDPWGLISQEKTSWDPLTPMMPIKLKVVPVDSVTCDATGVDMGSFTKLSGKIRRNLSDNNVNIYLQGRASNGVSIRINGEVRASNDSCLVISGTLSAAGNYGDMERAVAIVLENAGLKALKAQQEKERQEKARQEKERKENTVKCLFNNLMDEKRVSIKKKVNFGAFLPQVVVVDGQNANNQNVVDWAIEVQNPDGEAKSGVSSEMHLTLTLKSGEEIAVDFAEKTKTKLRQQNIDVFVWYSADIDEVLYLCNSSAFLLSKGKVFKLNKKTVQIFLRNNKL